MKVMLVGTQIDPQGGGAASAVRQLAAGLSRRGIEVVIVSTARESTPSDINNDGVKIYTFRPQNLYWIGDKDSQPAYKKALFHLLDIWNPQVWNILRTIIDREHPDVVHTHKLRGLSPSIWASARQAGITNLVHTCHDYELLSPEGTLSGGLGRRAARGSPVVYPYQSARRAMSHSVNSVTAPSRITLTRHTSLGYFSAAAQWVIPNSHGYSEKNLIDLEVKARDASKAADPLRPLRFLYLGRVDPPKGVDVLCAAFEKAVVIEPTLHLDVAGWGTMLETLRAQYRHIPHLTFHGMVEGSYKDELLASSDALIVPSVWEEVFGIVIIEAFAYGKPVIATSIGAIPELVTPGRTGYLVYPGDINNLASLLVRLANAPWDLREMSLACLEAAKSYTLESVTSAYLAAYDFGFFRQKNIRRR